MSIADDLAAITGAGPLSGSVVFGATTITAKVTTEDIEVPDEAGGTVLRSMTVLRYPVALLPTLAMGDAVTVKGVAMRVRDVRITNGGELRETLVA